MAGQAGLSREAVVGQAVVLLGLVIVALSFVVPFASNEAGCLDHCADEGRFYVWSLSANPGAPFLLIGVATSVLLWRSPKWRRRLVTWLGILVGWLGIYLYRFSAAWISELQLYGGPNLELHATRWLVVCGWIVLQAGTMLHALATTNPANLHFDRR